MDHVSNNYLILLCLLAVSSLYDSVASGPFCEVTVSGRLWPTPKLFVSLDSIVIINCTLNNTAPYWLIELANDNNGAQKQFIDNGDQLSTLHLHGLYRILQDNARQSTISLLINDTALNNGTVILCASYARSTSLSVFEPISKLEIMESHINAVNISWNQDSLPIDVSNALDVQAFLLTVQHGSKSQVVFLNDSFYHFVTPDNAKPCEAYNFTITTKYNFAGATYTGESCNISGSKSLILPSLSIVGILETSLIYSLVKRSSKVALTVMFMSAKECDLYPGLKYILEVESHSTNAYNYSESTLPGVENVIHNLTDNANYSFWILVSNSVGAVMTKRIQFSTTDVQKVTITLIDNMSSIVVHCDFISDYDAKGCMVVLVDEIENKSQVLVNITNSCKMEILTINSTELLRVLNNLQVFAYDIEFDGSVGHLKVPGVIAFSNVSISAECPSTSTVVTSTSGMPDLYLIIILILGGIALICITVLFSFIVIYYKMRRSNTFHNKVKPAKVFYTEPSVNKNCSTLVQCTDEELEEQAGEILYDEPVKAKERKCGDGAEEMKSKHQKNKDVDDRDNMNTYTELTEENHHYHTLEPQKPQQGVKLKLDDIEPDSDAPALPPPYKPPSPSQDQPLPEYQEIGALLEAKSKKRKEEPVCAEVINDQYQPSTSQVKPDESHTQALT